MKRTSLLISAALLSLIAGVQTAMAQKVTLYMAGNQTYECDIAQLDSIVFSEAQTIPAEDIVVNVDANGNADGGHQFTRLDETTFLIDGLKYKYGNGDLTVIGYDAVFFSGSAIIISKLIYNGRTMNVVSIGNESFKNCSSLTSVIIPNCVTSIGDNAFRDCSSLNSITIPESVTSIGNSAFSGCNSLTPVTIPNSVTSIGSSAFFGCSSLTSITIPNSVTSIGQNPFSDCTNLTSIKVETGNPTYDSRDNCNAIIETATNTLIAGCMNTVIPESVTSIGDGAFRGCTSLTSVTIPESMTSIGWHAFDGCTSLTSITIPESVASIGNYAFFGCSGLTSITIPESVTSIGYAAFYGCTSLTSVALESNNIVSTARENDSSMKTIFGNQVEKYIIGNSVTSIGYAAFYGCSGLTSIIIPNSVTSIGNKAFAGCISLTSIIVENGNTVYDSRNNCNAIIEKATNTLIAGCKNTAIPESVISIGNYAFSGCISLTSITIPNSVTGIGWYAFDGCSNLTSITIHESVTSIGFCAFLGCTSLVSITIPESVTSIGEHAFDGCSSLTSVTIPDGLAKIGGWVFQNCSSLTSVTIPNSVTSIGPGTFSGCTNLTSITISERVRSIDRKAFSNCSSLTNVYCYAKNVPSTGYDAFSNSSISSATLHVPAGSVNAYKKTSPWKDFGSIVAIE